MAEPITIARPYARAAFESASAGGALAAWSHFLAQAATWVRDTQIEPLIGDPRVRTDQLIGLLQELSSASAGAPGAQTRLTPAQLQEEQRNFLALLANNARLRLLPQVAVQYEALRAEAEHVADVEVSSALALSPEQTRGLKTALERRLGRAVRLHESVDPALLGGAVVRFGDFVVDGSLRRRVERAGGERHGRLSTARLPQDTSRNIACPSRHRKSVS